MQHRPLQQAAARWLAALTLGVALASALAGCGEDDNLRSSALNGAYRITSYTRNAESCAQLGPELPADERPFGIVFRISNDPEDNVMMGALCDGADTCAVFYDSPVRLRQRPDSFLLPNGDDAQGWSGRALTLIVDRDADPPQCSSDYIDYRLTSTGPDRVRLEARHNIRPLAPSESETCNTQDLQEVGPCARLDVIEAERLAP